MLPLFRIMESPALLGLDITGTSVKLLALSREGGKFRVESYAVVPLPANAVVEKDIKQADVVTEAIVKVLSVAKTDIQNVAVAVPDSFVITKTIQVSAALNEAEMESVILSEADKYIPYPLDEVNLDFEVIGPSAKVPEAVDVLLVASHTENVDARVAVVENAGLGVKIVDVESFAMERACELLTAQLPNKGVDQAIVVIDLGATMTTLSVIYNKTTIFSRTEVFGGEQLTKEIQQHYGLSYAEADAAKKQGNLPDNYTVEVLNPYKELAVLQIRRALQFFFSASQFSEINHIILAGGCANVTGLSELIAQQMGIPTSMANPFVNMTLSPQVKAAALISDAPALMISCGLALRSFDT